MNFDKVLETFVMGDYFLVFIAIMIMILIVLIVSLIKSRQEYNELLNYIPKNALNNIPVEEKEEKITNDLLEEFSGLMATEEEDVIKEDTPLVKQIDLKGVKTYNDIIDEYEYNEEENAVISADELEKRKRERLDALGTDDNQMAIEKYEEEQEKKAIISYSQLLKNASNITLSYKQEEVKEDDAPIVNKVSLNQKEVSAAENYLQEEEFLNILKEFRLTL